LASLLTVAGSRIALVPNRTYVFGRSPECDVPVDDGMCSRQHARVTVGATGRTVVVEDLKSRNGTYVNGERITGRTLLTDGCRLQIGATIYLLSLLEEPQAAEDVLLETGTLAWDQFAPGVTRRRGAVRVPKEERADFSGQLASFPLIDVLNILNRSGRSGTLFVETCDRRARIEIREGQIHNASCGDLRDFDALFHLSKERAGFFWLIETDANCRRTMFGSTDAVLLDLCRTLDEDAATDPTR